MRELELERELLANPVSSLQYMLRRLALQYEILPMLVVDGLFGEETLEAVMVFQREFFPPVTGIVDYGTWEAIRKKWEATEPVLQEPRPVRVFPGNGKQAQEGEHHRFLAVPQTMFQALSQYLNGISTGPSDGQHEGASVENVRWLQRRAGLEETGVLDQRTWDVLSRLYEVIIVPDAAEPEFVLPGWG